MKIATALYDAFISLLITSAVLLIITVSERIATIYGYQIPPQVSLRLLTTPFRARFETLNNNPAQSLGDHSTSHNLLTDGKLSSSMIPTSANPYSASTSTEMAVNDPECRGVPYPSSDSQESQGGLLSFVTDLLWPPIRPMTSSAQTSITDKPRPKTYPPRLSRSPDHTVRTIIYADSVTLFGYPSRGGLIILERATAVHFDFLNISRVDPPLTRAADSKVEDEFCQRLLLVGAKWFDSESRYSFMVRLRAGEYDAVRDHEYEKRPDLTLGERRWVEVGWPTEPAGALWVGEWDTDIPGILEEDAIVPSDMARMLLSANMDERCDILKRVGGAKYYRTLDEYEGAAYLKAWGSKFEGEIEPLESFWKAA